MLLIMNAERLQTMEQVKQFLGRSEVLELRVVSNEERYRWIKGVLKRFEYHWLKRAQKGLDIAGSGSHDYEAFQ
jgi:hypothetical protein